MENIRVALVSVNARVGEIRRNIDGMRKWIAAARQAGAVIVCFPELSITGYSIQPGIRSVAQPIPGDASRQLGDMAVSEGIGIMAGLVELDSRDRLFATHLIALPDGRTLIYRKVHLAPPEQTFYSPGNDVPVFDAFGMTFGIQLCYDAHFPELASQMALKGAEVIFIPHASPRGSSNQKHRSWMRHLPARAYDNSVFILAWNLVGENGEGLTFPGLAMAIGPSGDVIASSISDHEEKMLVVHLKADELDRVRGHRMRYFLPNRRPELYKL